VRLAEDSGDALGVVRAMLALDEVFGEARAAIGPGLDRDLAAALQALRERGSLGALAADGSLLALSSPASRR